MTTVAIRSSNSSKYRLCVQRVRVNFQTRSTGLSSGLYGGRKPSRSTSQCSDSHSRSTLAWCQRALSTITSMRRPLRLWRRSRCRKHWNDSALNFSRSTHVTRRPSWLETAPKTATALRVGACKTMGSLSSGGTHIKHREPCCWKWHSSSNQRSIMGLWAKRWSFFICPLLFGVGMGDHRTRFSAPEPQLGKQPLALANTKMDLILFSQVVTEEFSIPERLTVLEFSRRLAQVLLQFPPNRRIQRRGPTRAGDFLKTTKAVFLKALHPILHRASAVAEQVGYFGTTKTRTDHEDTMQFMVIARFFRTDNFLLYRNANNVSIFDFQSLHCISPFFL